MRRLNDFVAQAVAVGRSAEVQRTAAREGGSAKELAGDLRGWLAPETAVEEEADDFLGFLRRWVDDFAERGQPSTYKAYNTACNRLTAFARGRLRYDQLSLAFLKR